MSFKSLLTDRCSIYHIVETSTSPGYGLPGEAVFNYGELPDLEDMPCKFTEKGLSITQGEPGSEIVHSFAVSFLISADIRLNDKVIFEGAEYKAQIPRKVRNHHIVVTVIRKENL